MTLWKYLRSKILEHPSQIVQEGSVSTTYEELCIYAEKFAQKLTSWSYGIMCKSELAAAIALLSCIAAGKIAIPTTIRYGKEMCVKIIDRSDPPCIIHDFDGELKLLDMEPRRRYQFWGKAPAVMLYTSGSTGVPKGVMLSGDNIIANIEGISTYFKINHDDTFLISRPIYHSSVMTGELLLSLCSGAKIVFSSEPFHPFNIIDLIKKHNITVLGSTPTLMAALSHFVRLPNNLPVKTISISGECVTEGVAEKIREAFPNAKILCGYGLSEAAPRVAYLPSELFDECPTAAGLPLPNIKYRIVDKKNNDVEDGVIGELIVNGPNVMLGYFDDKEKTKNTLKNGWLYTGDLACKASNGLLYIKGRKDDMIIRAGMNIYPTEIENVLSTDDRVEGLLVYGECTNETQQICLNISGKFSDLNEVRALCKQKLPAYQMPTKINLVSRTDILNCGKKKRK